jgi:hypothetical protein
MNDQGQNPWITGKQTNCLSLLSTIINIKIPLQSLLAKLRAEGFEIGTSTILDLQRIIANVQEKNVTCAADLKYLLSPVICRNKEEQERFYRIFDEYLTSLEEQIIQPRSKEIINYNKKRWWIALPLLLLLVATLVYYFKPPKPVAVTRGIITFNSNQINVTGDTIGFLVEYQDSAKTTQFKTNWKITGDANYAKEFSGTDQVLNVFDSAGTYDVYATTFNQAGQQLIVDTTSVDVYCEVPPTLQIIQQETDTIYGSFSAVIEGAKLNAPYQYHWFVNDVSVKGDSAMETALLKAGQQNVVSLKVDWPGKKIHCSVDSLNQQLELQPPYQLTVTGNPKAPLTFNKQYNWNNILLGISGLFLLPLLAAAFIWWRYIRPKPKKEEVKDTTEPEELKGPFIIEFNNHQDKIMPETGISQLAEVLRKRHTSDVYRVDINKTIKTTIRQGGFPELEYVPRTQPTDFLIFLDKEFPEGHLTRLFSYVIDRLKKDQVHLTVYTFSREPLLLSNEGLNHVLLPIDKVARLYPDTMLIIFSQAKAFFKSYDVVLKNWVSEKFKSWGTKLLLTPLAKKDWGAEELALYQAGFTVVPADINSFNIISDEINHMIDRQQLKKEIVPETYGSRQFNFNRWRQVTAYLAKALNENKRQFNHISDINLIEQWLCALAVYPHLNWEVTIAIGKAFENKYTGSGRLVNYTNLLLISRISWMNDDQLMDSLRIEMLNKLENDKEALARQVIVELMKEIEPVIPTDSLVRNEFDFLHTTNKVLLNAHDQDRQTLSAEEWDQFKRYVDNDQVDWTLETYLQKGKNTLLTDPENPNRNLTLNSYIKAKERQGDEGLTGEESKPNDRLKKLLKKASPVISFVLIAHLSYLLLRLNDRLRFKSTDKQTSVVFKVDTANNSSATIINSLAVVFGSQILQGTSIGNNTYQVLNVSVTDSATTATLQVGLASGNVESDMVLNSSRYSIGVKPKIAESKNEEKQLANIELPQPFNEIWQGFDSSGEAFGQLAIYLKPKLVFSRNNAKETATQLSLIEAGQVNANMYRVIMYGNKKYEAAFFNLNSNESLGFIFCLKEQSSFDSLAGARKARLPKCNEYITLKPLYLPVAGLKSDANALSIQLPQNGTKLYGSEVRKFELALRRFNTLSSTEKQLVTVSISLNGFYKVTADVKQKQQTIRQSTYGKAFNKARWLYKPFNGNAFQRDYVTIDFNGVYDLSTQNSANQPECDRVFKSIKEAFSVKPEAVCKLDLSNQYLSSLPKEIYSFTKLQLLNITGNKIPDNEVTAFQARFPKCQVINSGAPESNQNQQQQIPNKTNLLDAVIKAALGEVNKQNSKQ